MPDATKKSLQAIIFDWAGTTVDHGSLAPVRTLQRCLCPTDIPVSDDVARRDMGLAKIDHIRKLLAEPEVLSIWKDLYGRNPREADCRGSLCGLHPSAKCPACSITRSSSTGRRYRKTTSRAQYPDRWNNGLYAPYARAIALPLPQRRVIVPTSLYVQTM